VSKVVRWPDLGSYGIFLGFTNIYGIGEKLIFVDMHNRGVLKDLESANIKPVDWSPRHYQGIYFLDTEERKFKPSIIAKAFNIHSGCPMTEKSKSLIIDELNKAYIQKSEENFRQFLKEATRVGINNFEQVVHEYRGRRYIYIDKKYIFEDQLADKSIFLSALDSNRQIHPKFLKQCLLRPAKTILSGKRISASALEAFGKIILKKTALSSFDIYTLQENLETTLYESFSVIGKLNDENSFDIAKRAYAAQPKRIVRTNETMELSQYSTPIPMSYVVQYILKAAIGNSHGKKTLLEPCIGNSSLVSLLSNDNMLSIKGFEIDAKRINAFNNMDIQIADATIVDFKNANSNNYFDYIIANPPFGRLEQKKIINGKISIQRLDYLIALRALESRKHQGYSVFILGGDGLMSNGEIKGGSKYFYNYLYDNYHVHGLVELSERLYQKNGANVNVRIVAIGNRFDFNSSSIGNNAPNKLEVIESYDHLMNWAKHVVNAIKNPVVEFNQIPLNENKLTLEENIDNELSNISPDGDIHPIELYSEAANEVLAKDNNTTKNLNNENRTYDLFDLTNISEKNNRGVNNNVKNDKILESANRIENEVKISQPIIKEISQQLNATTFKNNIVERHKNDLQVPYESASNINESTVMIPINLASGTYSAFKKIEKLYPDIDQYVCDKLKYDSKEQLGKLFSAEQIDALALAIFNHEHHNRSSLNADQTGIGKGRFVAGLMRYARLNEMIPVFITYKPSLMADIFRDIRDINSSEIFKNVFVINNTPIDDVFNPDVPLFKSMPYQKHKNIIDTGLLPDGTDLILGTYSQFSKEYEKSSKSKFLINIHDYKPFYFLDESHNAAGNSNTNDNLALALKNAAGVSFSSATALKTVGSFNLYQSLFPSSIDTSVLTQVLQAGGESLQEAVSICMAEDGVLVRREHDLSKLTFRVIHSSLEEENKNRKISDQVADILSMMSVLSGEISSHAKEMNKEFKDSYEKTDHSIKSTGAGKLQANSLNFGSRLFNITRQLLLGLQIDQTINQALEDLENNIKPVIGVENTGESFINQLINDKIFSPEDSITFENLCSTNKAVLSSEQRTKLDELTKFKAQQLENVYFENIPQFREYLTIMTKKLRRVSINNRYGVCETKIIDDPQYIKTEKIILDKINQLPNIPLIPIDYIRHKLAEKGFKLGEVSGRNIYLKCVQATKMTDSGNILNKQIWIPEQVTQNNATKTIVKFQNGDLDAIMITKAGSTGYSMHASPRYKDTRQRDFIALQKASNIAEYLQWIGRVNRKDQVIEPIITNLSVGLPAELRLTMMHNAKLRKLSANVTSNRENNNIENKDIDFLNQIGNEVACSYLVSNPVLSHRLNIPIVTSDESLSLVSDNYYINRLMSRLVLISVDEQNKIINDLAALFSERIAELDAKNINPFKVKIHDWKARTVNSYNYKSYNGESTDSSFDAPLTLTELEFDIKIKALTFQQINTIVENYLTEFSDGHEFNHLFLNKTDYQNRCIKLNQIATEINRKLKDRCFNNLPNKIKDKVGLSSYIDKYIDEWRTQENLDKYIRVYDLAMSALNFSHYNVGNYLQIINELNEIKVARIVGYLLPENKLDLTHGGRLGLKVIIAGDDKPVTLNMIRLNEIQKQLEEVGKSLLLDKNIGSDIYHKQIEQALNSTLLKRVRVMQNNLYKATELALENKMGIPILYTDDLGIRKRAILLKNDFSFESLKALPVKMNIDNMLKYHNEFFNTDIALNNAIGNFAPLFASKMKENSRIGLDIVLDACDSENYTMIIKDVKSKAAKLFRADHAIFSSNKEQNNVQSLNLVLTGNSASLQCNVSINQFPKLMEILRINHGINGLYLKNGSEAILKAIEIVSENNLSYAGHVF
jgi:hypothetical protein